MKSKSFIPSKKAFLFLLVGVFIFMLIGNVSATWLNDSYTKKAKVNFTMPVAMVNYTADIELSYDSDMQTDWDDIRFSNSSENAELGYWFFNNSNTYITGQSGAKINVSIFVGTVSAGVNSIYVYYGNSTITTTSNISNAFFFGDDFTALNSDWYQGIIYGAATATVTSGILNLSCTTGNKDYETKAKLNISIATIEVGAASGKWRYDSQSGGYWHWGTLKPGSSVPGAKIEGGNNGGTGKYWTTSDGSNTRSARNEYMNTSNYNIVKIKHNTTAVDFYYNGNKTQTNTANVPKDTTATSGGYYMGVYLNTEDMYFDWWYMRPVTEAAVTSTFDPEQSNGGGYNCSWRNIIESYKFYCQ